MMINIHYDKSGHRVDRPNRMNPRKRKKRRSSIASGLSGLANLAMAFDAKTKSNALDKKYDKSVAEYKAVKKADKERKYSQGRRILGKRAQAI